MIVSSFSTSLGKSSFYAVELLSFSFVCLFYSLVLDDSFSIFLIVLYFILFDKQVCHIFVLHFPIYRLILRRMMKGISAIKARYEMMLQIDPFG